MTKNPKTNEPLIIIGAGGHAKVLAATALAAGYRLGAIYDDDEAKWGSTLFGASIKGPLESLKSLGRVPAVIGIGSNQARKKIACSYDLDWMTIVHPFTSVHESVRLGVGSVVYAGSVLQPDVWIGDHVVVNTSSSADHDCRLGDYSQICPGVHLAGGVELGEGVFMGTGASVIPYKKIGSWTTVGAGAAVVRDIESDQTVVGVPAKQ